MNLLSGFLRSYLVSRGLNGKHQEGAGVARFLTTAEVAGKLRVSEERVRDLVKDGTLRATGCVPKGNCCSWHKRLPLPSALPTHGQSPSKSRRSGNQTAFRFSILCASNKGDERGEEI